MSNRRAFLKKSILLGLSTTASALVGKEQLKTLETLGTLADNKFILPELPYAYDALEPFIDAKTMQLHHSKHHQSYVDKLNTALKEYKGENGLVAIIKSATALDSAIRNNAGGHYNHTLFWKMMRPVLKKNQDNLPIGEVNTAIIEKYGTFERFKQEFSKNALSVFGSGWCWAIKHRGKLQIVTTTNQDNPLMFEETKSAKIILGIDVWEHAYYLNYQNQRANYINAWWNIMNWDFAESQWTTP
jgi:superoxide dismutase, Fe-Mn family